MTRTERQPAGADPGPGAGGDRVGAGPAPLRGVHHLKVAVSDLDRALDFYTRCLGATRTPEDDHVDAAGALYAVILDVPGLGTRMELRLDPEQARRNRGFDAITVAVDDEAALQSWVSHLDAHGVPHSRVITALRGWLVVLEDPDGNRLRLYTLETHGPDVRPDDDPWLHAATA